MIILQIKGREKKSQHLKLCRIYTRIRIWELPVTNQNIWWLYTFPRVEGQLSSGCCFEQTTPLPSPRPQPTLGWLSLCARALGLLSWWHPQPSFFPRQSTQRNQSGKNVLKLHKHIVCQKTIRKEVTCTFSSMVSSWGWPRDCEGFENRLRPSIKIVLSLVTTGKNL